MGSLLTGAKAVLTAKNLMIAGTAISAAGTIQVGRATAEQVKAQAAEREARLKSAQRVSAYNALVMKREAEAKRQKAKFEQTRQAKRGARIKSALIAKVAAKGGLGSPVAADLAAEQVAELELENLLIGYEGEVLAKRAESQAELDKLQASIYGQQGALVRRVAKQKVKNIRTASYLSAGQRLLTGFGATLGYGNIYDNKRKRTIWPNFL